VRVKFLAHPADVTHVDQRSDIEVWEKTRTQVKRWASYLSFVFVLAWPFLLYEKPSVKKYVDEVWYFKFGRCASNVQSYFDEEPNLFTMDLKVKKCGGNYKAVTCLVEGLSDGIRKTEPMELGRCSSPQFRK
jgi:hypothetical protein